MSDAESAFERQAGERGSIILLSAFFGPMIGGAILWLALLVRALWQPFDGSILVAATGFSVMLLLFSGFGVVVGFVPALISGVAYAYSPRNLQRLFLSPIFGYVPTLLYFLIIGFGQAAPEYGLLGAATAFICAVVFRILALDIRGLERKLISLPSDPV